MRKTLLILTVIALAVLFSLAAVAKDKGYRFYLGVNAGYLMPDFSHSFTSSLLGTELSGQYNIYTNPILGVEGGVKLTDHIGVYAGYDRFFGKLNAKFDFSIVYPSFQPISFTLTNGKATYNIGEFGLVYNFGGCSAINPYLRGGIVYIKGNIDLVSFLQVDIDVNSQILDYHSSFTKTTFSTTGGIIGGGITYRVSNHLGLNLGANYLYGKTTLPELLTTTNMEVNLGGIHINGGLRFYF